MCHHAVLIRDKEEARVFLKEIGADVKSYKYMVPKAVHRCIKLKGISAVAANILKQEMLARGGEAAVKRRTILLDGNTDVLLMGTLKQYQSLVDKLHLQPFGLKVIADQIDNILNALERYKYRIKLANHKELVIGNKTLIMGILNITPDSFYDRGRYYGSEVAVERALQMIDEGADIIDIGGASSRPGARIADEQTEIRRILPVIKELAGKDIIISVDTFRAEVARIALDNGVNLINDIGRLQLDPDLLPVLVKNQAPVILMHNRLQFDYGKPYEDLLSDIIGELKESIDKAVDRGLAEDRIIIDPGLGFGKNDAENRLIIKRLWELKSLGKPLLIGASRKLFIGETLGLEASDRLEGSLAIAALSIINGADIIRVHDVGETKRVALMIDAVMASNG